MASDGHSVWSAVTGQSGHSGDAADSLSKRRGPCAPLLQTSAAATAAAAAATVYENAANWIRSVGLQPVCVPSVSFITHATLASAGISCRCVSVRPSD